MDVNAVAIDPNDAQVLYELCIATKPARWLSPGNCSDAFDACNLWPDDYRGVWCNDNGRVLGITMTSTGMTGYLPDSIGNLSEVTQLYLGKNAIRGTFPNSITKLTKLRNFWLYGGNFITGTLPEDIGNLTELKEFNIEANNFSGTIPKSIGYLEKLVDLYIMSNYFTGTIPDVFGNMRLLQSFDLYNNRLTGTLPPSLGNAISLVVLHIQNNNNLTGTIPPSYRNLVNMIQFDTTGSSLSGCWPFLLTTFTCHTPNSKFCCSNDSAPNCMALPCTNCSCSPERAPEPEVANTQEVVTGVVSAFFVVFVLLAVGLGYMRYRRIGLFQGKSQLTMDRELVALLALNGVKPASWVLDGKVLKKRLSPESDEYKKVVELLMVLDGANLVSAIKSITAAINPRSGINFENQRTILRDRFINSAALFKKTDWARIGDRQQLRAWVARMFEASLHRHPWNAGADEVVPVLPVVHGTDASVAWKIFDTGFSALSTLDAGFYGRGIYFTSSAQYSLPYCSTKPNPAIVLCLAVPGNIYPVVEDRLEKNSWLGKPIKSGYQSNYVLTAKDGKPCMQEQQVGSFYDELVVDQVQCPPLDH